MFSSVMGKVILTVESKGRRTGLEEGRSKRPVSCPGSTRAALHKGLVRGVRMSGRTERRGRNSPHRMGDCLALSREENLIIIRTEV